MNELSQIEEKVSDLQRRKNDAEIAMNKTKMELYGIKQQLSDKQAIYDKRLNILSLNIEQNNIMMKEMQNNMNEITKQIMDITIIIIEKRKNNDLYEMRKQIKSLKQNVNKIMNEKSNNDKTENKKLEAMKLWMINVVKLPQYIPVFVKNGFDDLDIIKHITMNELTMIGIDKIGDKIKITKSIQAMNE